jgi:anti-sigma regulatory factor (Ser/Thr protein kinase)
MTDDERLLAEFSVPSAHGHERVVMERVGAALAACPLEPGQRARLRTAVAEAALNAIEHGNRDNPALPVDVQVRASATHVRVAVTDRGGRRDLAAAPAPDLAAKLAGRERPRGWGLYLVEHLVDGLTTRSDGERRTVELVLRIGAAPGSDELTEQHERSR